MIMGIKPEEPKITFIIMKEALSLQYEENHLCSSQ